MPGTINMVAPPALVGSTVAGRAQATYTITKPVVAVQQDDVASFLLMGFSNQRTPRVRKQRADRHGLVASGRARARRRADEGDRLSHRRPGELRGALDRLRHHRRDERQPDGDVRLEVRRGLLCLIGGRGRGGVRHTARVTGYHVQPATTFPARDPLNPSVKRRPASSPV